jgi:ribosomal protein L37AE/L43A
MQIDPVQEWQRLAAEYRQKCDNELLELARDYADLTEPAQQALRAEMRSRGLGDPENPKSVAALRSAQSEPTQPPLPLKNAPWAGDPVDIAFGAFGATAPEPVPDTPDEEGEDDVPHEYTWKTPVCECETSEQAQQLVEALRKAGIDGWVDGAGSRSRYSMSSLDYPRVLVAADQLDQARAIAAQPIPQEIVDDEKEEVPEFVEPKCPKCGSDDVVLEGVDPENTWRCEQCDEQWTETPPQPEGEAPEAAKNPF